MRGRAVASYGGCVLRGGAVLFGRYGDRVLLGRGFQPVCSVLRAVSVPVVSPGRVGPQDAAERSAAGTGSRASRRGAGCGCCVASSRDLCLPSALPGCGRCGFRTAAQGRPGGKKCPFMLRRVYFPGATFSFSLYFPIFACLIYPAKTKQQVITNFFNANAK